MLRFQLTTDPDQQFSVLLNRRRCTVRIRYNSTNDRWFLDLSIDDQPVMHGRRIVLGVDLLEPFNFGIGLLFASTTMGCLPDRTRMVDGCVNLYHATEEEFLAAQEALDAAVPA